MRTLYRAEAPDGIDRHSAERVPIAPKATRTVNEPSSTMGDVDPIAVLASTEPVETTSALGASFGAASSQVPSSVNIRWQKPQPAFQKRTAAAGCGAR
jgi:hypothetical protein